MGPDSILQQFSQHLTNEGKVKTTIQSYTTDIRGFLEWLSEKQVDFQGQLTRFYVTSYREHLLEEQYTISTINKKVNSLNSFNQFLIHQGHCSEQSVYPNRDKIKVANGSETEIEVFSEKEAEQILFYLEDRKKVT